MVYEVRVMVLVNEVSRLTVTIVVMVLLKTVVTVVVKVVEDVDVTDDVDVVVNEEVNVVVDVSVKVVVDVLVTDDVIVAVDVVVSMDKVVDVDVVVVVSVVVLVSVHNDVGGQLCVTTTGRCRLAMSELNSPESIWFLAACSSASLMPRLTRSPMNAICGDLMTFSIKGAAS